MVSIDGTDISGVTIDGTDVSEITVDGDVVWVSEQIQVWDFDWGVSSNWNSFYGSFRDRNRSYGNGGSVGINDSNTNKDTIARWTTSEITNGTEIKEIEFFVNESSDSNGYGVVVDDSNGNGVFGVGSSNPEMSITDGKNFTTIGMGGYNTWFRVNAVFNWSQGTYDWIVENTSSGSSSSGTNNLYNSGSGFGGVRIEDMGDPVNLGGSNSGSVMDFWFDELKVRW